MACYAALSIVLACYKRDADAVQCDVCAGNGRYVSENASSFEKCRFRIVEPPQTVGIIILGHLVAAWVFS